MTVRITDAVLRALEPGGKGVRDQTLWGFIARRTRKGTIEYSVRRQSKHRPLYASIGHSPPLSLTQARAKATQLLAAHELGAPIPEAAPPLSAWTIERAWESYQTKHFDIQGRAQKAT